MNSADGTSTVMPRKKAEAASREAGTNLLFVSRIPGNKPTAVVRMVTKDEYQKEEYAKKKAAKEKKKAKKKSAGETKIIQLTINSEANDIQVKARQADKFLAAGGRVKVAVGFKLWDNEPQERAKAMVESFVEELSVDVTAASAEQTQGKKHWAEFIAA